MVKATEHPLGSVLMLTVFKQLFNGFGLAQIGTYEFVQGFSHMC